jgi:hypothetical protein
MANRQEAHIALFSNLAISTAPPTDLAPGPKQEERLLQRKKPNHLSSLRTWRLRSLPNLDHRRSRNEPLFGYEADTWGISLNVKNFTNQRYYVEANAAGAVVGEPLSAFLKIYIKQ